MTHVLNDVLSAWRPEAIYRLRGLMARVAAEDLTVLEALAVIAVVEVADLRVNAPAAPVLQLLLT